MRQVWWMAAVMVLAAGCTALGDEASTTASHASGASARHTAQHASTPGALELLAKAIGGHRLVLLGEIHGTREIPALVGALVDRESARGNKVILALEITVRDQAGVNLYLRSPGTARDRSALLSGSHWREPMHDGRDSAAMVGLIEQVRSLRAEARDVAIVYFDPGDTHDRNRGMADNLRATVSQAPDARVLVLTGNVHAMTSAPPWEMLDGGKRIEPPVTAGRLLADLHPFSIDIEAVAGDAWTCNGTCNVHRIFARDATARAPSLELQSPSDSPWHAMLLLPRFSASLPAIQVSSRVAPATPQST